MNSQFKACMQEVKKAQAEGWLTPVSEWEYVKEFDCWRNKETGECKPYEPENY